ncbi:MAG: hypothetical protein HQL65_14730 [Magnetococcales bacterium]|nr:hypothetical protein [Magnetococcales bacterium]
MVDILYWIHAQVSPIAKGDPDILVDRLPEGIWPILARIRAFMTTDLPFPTRDPRLPRQDLLITIPLATNILDGHEEYGLNYFDDTYKINYDDVDFNDIMDIEELLSPRSVQSMRRERYWPETGDPYWPFTLETWNHHQELILQESPIVSSDNPATVDRPRRNLAADLLDRACRERDHLARIESALHGPCWRKSWKDSAPLSGYLSMANFWNSWPDWMEPPKNKVWIADPVLPAIKSWLTCQHDASKPFSHTMAICYEDAVWPVLERCRLFLRTDLEFPAMEPAFVKFKPLMFQDYARNQEWASVTWPPDSRIWPDSVLHIRYPDLDCSPNHWMARQERYWPLEGDEVWPFPPDTDPQYVRDLVKRHVEMT